MLKDLLIIESLHMFKILVCQNAYSARASLWPHRGGSQHREPPKNFFDKIQKVNWSLNKCFSYGSAPYFA